MGAVKTRSMGVRTSAIWIAAVAVAVIATACAQIPGDTGSASTTSISEASADALSTTTAAGKSEDIPPKPEGEPDIELLPIQPQMIEITIDPETGTSDYAELLAEYFSFETVSGYDSYTVTFIYSYEAAEESGTNIVEGRVEGTSSYFIQTGDMREPYEVVVSLDVEAGRQETWVRVDGGWVAGGGDYLGLFALSLILPEVVHSTFIDTFGTLTFVDWDLIDGVWYARYAASAQFVAANLGYDRNPERLVDTEGDVWVSPKGFIHSFEISATDVEDEALIESTWRLSDLGTTSVDVPTPADATPSTTTTTDASSIVMLEELLATEFWDPTVVLDARPFRWRSRTRSNLVDLDPSDVARYEGEDRTSEARGSVGPGGIERQRTVIFDTDTGEAVEFVQFDGTYSRRYGSVDVDGTSKGVFEPDDDPPLTYESEARPTHVGAGLLAAGYRFYNNYETPALEIVGVQEIAGVRATHLRSVIVDGGDDQLRFDATFDFWIDEGSLEPRILRMTYFATSTKNLYTNAVVTGRAISESSLDVFDVGDASIIIESP